MGAWTGRLRRPTAGAIVFALLVGIAAAGFAAQSVLREPKIYESFAVLVIDQPRAVAEAGSEGIVSKLNRLRAKYATLLRTSVIVDPVASKLGLPPGQVANALSSSLPGNSLVIVVVARTSRPGRAREIADTAGDELVAYLHREMEMNKIPTESHITLTVVQGALPGRKIAPLRSDAVRSGAIAGGLALVVGYWVVQGIFSRRARRRR